MRKLKVDRWFLIAVAALVLFGFFIFTSASMGLLARSTDRFFSIALNHILFGLVFGGISAFIMSKIHYKFWRKYAFWFFLAAIIITLGVFIPGIGFKHGGAYRWISIGSYTFQPSEILKIGYLIYLAAWLSKARENVSTFAGGIFPYAIITGIVAVVFLLQPDTDTFLITATAGGAMLFASGAKLRHLALIMLIGAIMVSAFAWQKPYLVSRIKTFWDPSRDPRGAGYQIQQSLIAIGSGQMFGRGFGQSVQKFNFLPEPVGDSIFAVAAEEFGFVGGVFLIFLIIFFTFRGIKISIRAPDSFSGLLTLGIVILIVCQSFLNIGAMLGVLPLSGNPLVFVSQGGTAMLFALTAVGIILNVSKHQKKA
jgi:cell division protein FtsW